MFPIMFIPFGPTFFIGIIAVMFMSLISKTLYTQKTKDNILKGYNPKQATTYAFDDNRLKVLAINSSILALMGIMYIVLGVAMMPAFIATLFGFIFIGLTNTFILKSLLIKTEE
jgi:uncharacterized membrane protein